MKLKCYKGLLAAIASLPPVCSHGPDSPLLPWVRRVLRASTKAGRRKDKVMVLAIPDSVRANEVEAYVHKRLARMCGIPKGCVKEGKPGRTADEVQRTC